MITGHLGSSFYTFLGLHALADNLTAAVAAELHVQVGGFEERIVRVGHQVVKPDAAADEHFLDAGQLPDTAEDLEVVAVVHDHVGAGLRGQTVLAAVAHAPEHLLPAGGEAEVGGRPADVYSP